MKVKKAKTEIKLQPTLKNKKAKSDLAPIKSKSSVNGTKGKQTKVKTTNGTEQKTLESKALPKTNGIKKNKLKEAKNVAVKKTQKDNKHKVSQADVDGLKNIDPEFYEFLKKNDKKLLDFNVFDSDDDESDLDDDVKVKKVKPSKHDKPNKKKKELSDESNDEETDAEEDDGEGDDLEGDDIDSDEYDSAKNDEESDDADEDEKFHRPDADLEVASDESDFEDIEEETVAADGTQTVTLNLLRQWQLQLEQDKVPIDVLRKVTQAFSSALASISSDENEARAVPTAFKVVGPATFNGIIQLCVLHLQPAILRFLGLKARSNIPLHKTKKWVKVRGCLRYYFTDLIRLVEQVSSPNILSVLLKHLHQMAGMVASFSTLGKSILKRLIVLWSTSDETVRVIAFLCILKITRNQQISMLNHVLKAMYLSYVRNSKFVSPNTLPAINFMRRSLVEMFALDLNVAYQHAFLYIRQLAIHLRNAVILKKKDSFQAVYNWQFVNSLRLWVDLLGATANKPQLKPLVYPLVTIATGVVRLIPTAQYFPLRFHCLQSLISLCKQTSTFIPVLPLILEVLRSKTFNRKHTSVSMKPLPFTCILRLNKGQLAENGFRDEVIEQVCALTLEYLAHESASLAFSDLIVPTVVAIKAYLKECRNANYSRKLKQLLDKIQENARFIEQERSKINFGLEEITQVHAWETHVRNKGTPLNIYYNSWVKTHETKKRRQAAQVDSINSDYNLPMIKRRNISSGNPVSRTVDGEVELFPSDSEGDDELIAETASDDDAKSKPQPKQKKKKDKQKPAKLKPTVEEVQEDPENDDAGNVDIVKDLDMNDW